MNNIKKIIHSIGINFILLKNSNYKLTKPLIFFIVLTALVKRLILKSIESRMGFGFLRYVFKFKIVLSINLVAIFLYY